jgi:hypothetical protein
MKLMGSIFYSTLRTAAYLCQRTLALIFLMGSYFFTGASIIDSFMLGISDLKSYKTPLKELFNGHFLFLEHGN